MLLFARALASAGHRVDLVTADATKRKTFDYQGLTLTPDEALLGKKYDVAIATWYETIALAERLAPVAIHFCQGYEADLIHLSDKFEAIAEAYSRALPALVVSPHLAARLADRFATRCVVMPPLLDPDFRPRRFARGPGKRPRIILQGIFEAEVKRVRLGLEAFALLQKRLPSDLVRVSVLPLSKGERDCGVSSEFYSDVRPVEVAALTARSSLTLFTSTSAEGFGLPVLEGLAAGTPVVAVRIPSLAV
ncbi:MAG: glycosyltransferase, partial [Flavobacteriaceae bacterium]